MSEMKKLHDFTDSWYVDRIIIERETPGPRVKLSLRFTNDSEFKEIVLIHPDSEKVFAELLDAERVSISEETDSQREFGTILIECFGESYFKCWCDSIQTNG